MANKTVQQIYTAADDLLRQDGASTGIPGLESSATIGWIDELQKQFFDEYTTKYGNFPAYMKRHYGIIPVSGTELAASTAAAATSLTVDSSSALASSGAGVIYKNSLFDIFTFTGNSAGSVTGIPASGVGSLDFAHDAGDAVYQLYALPSDFGRMRTEKERGEGVRVNGSSFSEVPDLPYSNEYSLWQNPTTSAWYLWLPRGTTGDTLVTYDRKPTTLTATTDTIDIPEQYADHWYIIWGLVAIFRQVLDEDYVPTKELQRQQMVLQAAFARPNVGKRLSASNAYFRRYGL